MAKIAWHTDIVVDGQGMNVKIARPVKGCARVVLMPDVPGRKADRAKKRFMKAMPEACSIAKAKVAVERAIRHTRARWNEWHHETY